mgnify:FL=1
MKLIYFFFFFIFFSGFNECIVLTGRFINRLNDPKNLNTSVKITAYNLQTQQLPNILISIANAHDSVLITTPKFTTENGFITFSLPEEQINSIPEGATNIIIIAEHPLLGIMYNSIPMEEVYENTSITREFIIDIDPSELSKKNIHEFQFYNKARSRNYR